MHFNIDITQWTVGISSNLCPNFPFRKMWEQTAAPQVKTSVSSGILGDWLRLYVHMVLRGFTGCGTGWDITGLGLAKDDVWCMQSVPLI